MTNRPTKSVCVYCGSRPGADPAYLEAAREFGSLMASRGWRLVYGAGDIGLMGEIARSAQDAGGETFGVIPEHLVELEMAKTDLTRVVVTGSMHERKNVMLTNANAVAVLPGGAGSLDEFFEVLTWRQLGIHDKPIVVLNVNGFWDPLRGLLEQVVSRGFAEESLHSLVSWADSAPDAIALLESEMS